MGLNGAGIDGGWFADVQAFVRDTSWLHAPVLAYATYGIVLFAVLALLAWWPARQGDAATMAAVLWIPFAVVLGFLANDVVKTVFDEPRPCRSMPTVPIISPCDAPTDWAFPSNHSAIAGAAAVSILIAHRAWGWVAVVCALLMAFARVYVGVHYPHDVIVGLALGGLIGLTGLAARRWGAPIVERLRHTGAAPLVGAVVREPEPVA